MLAAAQGQGSLQVDYRGYRVAAYLHPEDLSYGFSLFRLGAPKGAVIASEMSHKGLQSMDEALALGKKAVDLALQPGVGGLEGFSFGSIGKMFSKVGKGVTDNVGVLSTVGGAMLTATGVGAPIGIALATAGTAAQGGINAQKEKKAANAAKKDAEAQAKAAEAAAAAAAGAVVDPVTGVAIPKTKIWPWVAAGGGGLILIAVVAWAALRKKG